MTVQSVFASGGMSSLTELNARLVALAADTHTEAAEAAENEILGVGGVRPADPEDDDPTADATPEVRGRFSTEDPFGFNRVKEWIEQRIFGGSSTGRSPLIGAFVNEWAETISPDVEEPFPDNLAERLLADEEFQAGAGWLPVREQLDELPPTFRTNLDGVDFTVVNNPLTGPEFVEERLPEEIVPARPIVPVRRIPVPEDEAASDRAIRRAADEERTDEELPVVAGDAASDRAMGRAAAERAGGAEGGSLAASDRAIRRAIERNRADTPFIDEESLIGALQPPSAGGGGGRRGGGTRRAIEFDKDHLVSQTADLYNRWMLQPGEAPPSIVSGIVDRYIREARSLWSGKGVRKDFDTFVRGELKKLPRYKTIYTHKLPGQSEEEFIQSFRQPIASLGFRPELERSQTESAVTSGGGPAAQFQRVSRSREAQVQNAGDLSQRLAQTLAGVGIG